MNYLSYLNPENSDDYQFIYSSQLYGTFFCIYAWFNADESRVLPKGEEGVMPVSNINFQIINYKGPVNIGITHINHMPLIDDEGLEFKIEVQAMNGSIDYPYVVDYCFKPNEKIIFTRKVKPLNPPGTAASAIPLTDLKTIFDTEKWERNGLILPIRRTDKHENQPQVKAPGLSCIEAMFIVK